MRVTAVFRLFTHQRSFRAYRALALLICGFWALAILFSASPASAQGASQVAEIRSQMDRGQGLFLAKKYEEAARVFEDGYKAHPYSAFLFNAGVCYQRVGKASRARDAFQRYLKSDPHAPDAPAVRERIKALDLALAKAESETEIPEGQEAAEVPAVVAVADEGEHMKSLVLIETAPAGAPVKVYLRTEDYAPPYKEGAKNTLWTLVTEAPSPLNLTLDVGTYHVVIEEFQDFNRSEADIVVAAGHVHHFQANLSQGEFLGFLELTSNVVGARIYIDDDGSKKTLWGEAPHGALIAPGKHTILLEAPGYESKTLELEIKTSDKQTLNIPLMRVGFGVLRLDADIREVTVSVDQKMRGVWREGESAFEIELQAGSHDLLVSARGHKDLRQTVRVPPGQILPVRAKMIQKYPRGVAWTQAAFSAAFIGAGVYFGVESNRLNKELQADRDARYLHSADPRLAQGTWYSVGADSAFALGGILALLSTYNFLKDPYPDPQLYQGKQVDFKRMRTAPAEPEKAGPQKAQAGSVFHFGVATSPSLSEVH